MATPNYFGSSNAGFQAGYINGPVNTTFHLPSPQPHAPPRPSIVIPFTRDAHFVERGTILEQIGKNCCPGARVGLVGLGGVGKSQLAIEHAYRIRELSPETWVFWVHASNAARFEQSFRDIADCVEIAGRKDSSANIFQLVCGWLRRNTNRWLIVLDNVDDAQFLVAKQAESSRSASKCLLDYLPHCEQGSILVTSRTREAASYLAEPQDLITIDAMDKDQAVTLLKRKLISLNNHDIIVELAVELECMPLAIVQAAAYISQNDTQCSVSNYLEKLRCNDDQKTNLLNYKAGQLRRDRSAKNSIIKTWQVSFEHLRATRPSAADLLSLMSFFDRQGIPRALLRRRELATSAKEETKHEASSITRPFKLLFRPTKNRSGRQQKQERRSIKRKTLKNDLQALRDFYFISAGPDGTTFEMHALVQLATRTWLAANNKLERRKSQFISNLNAAFPSGDYETWLTCQALFPHVKSALEQRVATDSSRAKWEELFYNVAHYSRSSGDLTNAEILAKQSYKMSRTLFGLDHASTFSNFFLLGAVYIGKAQYNKAANAYQRAIEISKKVHGARHSATLLAMSKLAEVHYRQEKLEDAELLQLQVLKMQEKILEVNHGDILQSRWGLVDIYLDQKRLESAEELCLQVLGSHKIKYGDDHPFTVSCMGLLARIYVDQGALDRAEELQRKVLERSKMILGLEHPDTLVGMYNLAVIWKRQSRNVEALDMLRECIRLGQQVLGMEHPHTLIFMSNLAEWEEEVTEADTRTADATES